MELDQKERKNAVNPPYGHKGDFRKITMTISPTTYERLLMESIRRRATYEPNHLLSALAREALDDYFMREHSGNAQLAEARSENEKN